MKFKNKNFFMIYVILVLWIVFGGIIAFASGRDDDETHESQIKEDALKDTFTSSGESKASVLNKFATYVAYVSDPKFFEGEALMCDALMGPYVHTTIDGNSETFEEIEEHYGYLQYEMMVDKGDIGNLWGNDSLFSYEMEYRKYYKYIELKKEERGRINDPKRVGGRTISYESGGQTLGLWLYFSTNSTLDVYRRDGKERDGGNGALLL